MSNEKTRQVWRPPTLVEFIGSFPKTLPAPGLPEISFAGRSNVGKSSAINALLGRRKAARVSGRPGRTQAINLFRVDERMSVADLPGYGFAKVPEAIRLTWKGMIESYLGDRTSLRLVVVLVDSRHTAQDLDLALIGALKEAHLPFIVVATKVDKLKRSKRKRQLDQLAEGLSIKRSQLLGFSSMSFEGRDRIWALIEAAIAQ
jgi:GTP-binding protein